LIEFLNKKEAKILKLDHLIHIDGREGGEVLDLRGSLLVVRL
jgi:hypothetical protein